MQSGFFNQIFKAKQYVSEIVGTGNITDLDEEFIKVESIFQTYYELLESLTKNCKDILYPNRTNKIFTNTANKLLVKEDQVNYPHPEMLISNDCEKFGNFFKKHPIGSALLQISNTFKTLTLSKQGREDLMRQDFFQPLKNIRCNEMQTIFKSRKKLDNYRLKYDALKQRCWSNVKLSNREMIKAKLKFQKIMNDIYKQMRKFLIADTGSSALLRYSHIQMEYHEFCLDSFDKCYKSLKDLSMAAKRENIIDEVEEKSEDEGSYVSSTQDVNEEDLSECDESESQSSNDNDESTQQPHCEVLFNFKGSGTNYLTLRKGDIVHLHGKLSDDWLIGELNGNFGIFPLNHVDIIVPLKE